MSSAEEIPVTQARAAFADLVNRVGYGGERIVVTRHGRPLAALVSAADLERLRRLDAQEQRQREEPPLSRAVSELGPVPRSAPPAHRFGIAAERRSR
jgi:prevent-host-death family protein